MKTTNPHRSEAGFSIQEVLISGVILAALLLGGLVAVRSSLEASTTSTVTSEAASQVSRGLRSIHQILRQAGRSTLTVELTGTSGPQPIADAVDYDNIGFHRAIDYTGTAIEYAPLLTDPPAILRLDADPADPAGGRLVYGNGTEEITLAHHVDILTFHKDGSRIDVTLGQTLSDQGDARAFTLTRSVVLRTP
jgi:hypothetical protein